MPTERPSPKSFRAQAETGGQRVKQAQAEISRLKALQRELAELETENFFSAAGQAGELEAKRAEAAEALKNNDLKTAKRLIDELHEWEKEFAAGGDRSEAPLRRAEFHLKDIPAFDKLPSEQTLKEDYALDQTWNEEYRADRSISDFALTDKDLKNIGIKDADQRQALLESVAESKESPAEIFDIGDIIKHKQQENPKHRDSLSTKELLEAIDAAGYRPATLLELLAYSKNHWKPNPKDKLTDEEKLQRADAPYIYALGSAFSRAGGSRSVPCLDWDDGRRDLSAVGFDDDWDASDPFLVLRKASS